MSTVADVITQAYGLIDVIRTHGRIAPGTEIIGIIEPLIAALEYRLDQKTDEQALLERVVAAAEKLTCAIGPNAYVAYDELTAVLEELDQLRGARGMNRDAWLTIVALAAISGVCWFILRWSGIIPWGLR